jgi:hypothetical protein
MRDGDIYRWSWNQKEIEKRENQINAGTLYWCYSRIGIWNEEQGRLYDTFWNSIYDNKSFSPEDIERKLDIKFVANMNDLKPVSGPYVFENYDDSDCVNISHANMMSGGFYIKKDAKPSLTKKQVVIDQYIYNAESNLRYWSEELERLNEKKKTLTADSAMPCYKIDYHKF